MYNIKFLVQLNQIWYKHEEMLGKFTHYNDEIDKY